MRQLTLHGKYGEGKFTLIDDNLFDELNKFRWILTPQNYVIRTISHGSNNPHDTIYLHREILKLPYKPRTIFVDHVNGNRLDNRKNNLRTCTKQQNSFNNKSPIGVSGYRGVIFLGNFWVAKIHIGGDVISAGRYKTARAAALKRDALAKKYHGEFAVLNFP